MDPIIFGLAVVLALNLFIFQIAYKLQTDKLTDITYALSFGSIAVFGYIMGGSITSISKIIVAGLILAWAIRLGSFLFYRVSKRGKDDRFDKIRTNPKRFFRFFLIQAVSSWIIALPFLLYLLDRPGMETGWGDISVIEYTGLIIALLGLIIETIADQQKLSFKSIPENKDQLFTKGLYGPIQYPNYLGEILFWVGVFICSVPVLTGPKWLSVSSPIIIILLLLFLTGIPPIEKSRRAKYKDDPDYNMYVQNTSKIIPGIY